MAIWQFSFLVVPKEKVLRKIKDYSQNIKIDDIKAIMSWNGYSLTEPSLKEISKVLRLTRSWSDDIIQFGLLEESCIELCYEHNILEEVSMRLDLRNITIDILSAVSNFIKVNNAIIITRNGAIVKPENEDIIEEIRKLDAYSFVKNPKQFLDNLSKQKLFQ